VSVQVSRFLPLSLYCITAVNSLFAIQRARRCLEVRQNFFFRSRYPGKNVEHLDHR
jgi:hypothetical protein